MAVNRAWTSRASDHRVKCMTADEVTGLHLAGIYGRTLLANLCSTKCINSSDAVRWASKVDPLLFNKTLTHSVHGLVVGLISEAEWE